MKGLLLKDFYTVWTDLKAFLLLNGILIIAARFSETTSFMLYYPCILSGMIAMTLVSYDESAKWHIYALTLPYTRAQLVSSKYLVGLSIGGGTVVSTCLVQLTRAIGSSELPGILFTMLPMTLLPTALLLPFIYKLGSEKGRMAYYMVLGGFCGIASLLSSTNSLTGNGSISLVQDAGIGIPVVLLSVLAYAVSWRLSIRFFQKRDL